MFRNQKVEELVRHLAAEYLSRESNRTSLITVTNVRLNDNSTKATILISVLPEEREKEAVEFAKRNRNEFRSFLMERVRMRSIPQIDFEIDRGEKNRQKLDTLAT